MKRLLAVLLLAAAALNAQCVMCFRTAAAQQIERAKVLNYGIFIMLVPPFAILGGFLLLAWRRNSTYAGADGRITDSETLRPVAADNRDAGDGPAGD